MAFVGGNQQFPGQFPVSGPVFQSPPIGFPTQQGIPLTASGLPQLNFGGQVPQQQFRPPVQNFVPNGQTFNPLLGPQVAGGGGAVFGGPQQQQQTPFQDPSNMSTSDFYNTIIGMQFATGDFISTAMGVSGSLSDANNPGSMLNVRQLGQQFQGIYSQIQQQESQVADTALQQYNEMKNGMFADAHYEFDAAGKPSLQPGAETTQQKAQRMQYERRQSIAVDQAFANHPLNQRIQQLTQLVDQFTKSGQPIMGLMLELDATQTQLGLQKTAAHLQAEGIPTSSNQSETANAAAQSLRDFANSALNDYAGMHQFNVQQLANNPITRAYFEAMAAQQRGMLESQLKMQQASQQMMGMLGGGGATQNRFS